MCVRNVDVHVSCSSHVNAQLAAFFIDPRAKGSTEMVCIFLCYLTPRREASRPHRSDNNIFHAVYFRVIREDQDTLFGGLA